MIKEIVLTSLVALSGCAAFDATATKSLTDAGVSASTAKTVVADTNKLGDLACKVAVGADVASPLWVLIPGANVVSAGASEVAAVCRAYDPSAVPGPLPAGVTAQVATVTSAVQAAIAGLNASKT